MRLLIELESPGGREFDDAKYEWRRLFSELLGTFLLVLAGAGGAVVNAQSGGQISRTAAVTAPAMLFELVLTAGLFSVILGTASRAQNVGPMSALGVAGYIAWVYIVGPLAGAAIAVGIAYVLRGPADAGGAAAAQGRLGPPDVHSQPGA
jgi:aquaporin Z